MSGKTYPVTYLCGGDFTPADRDACPNPLHDWPLARGYVDASEQASRRLNNGWANKKCPECGLYGWYPGRKIHETDQQVPPPGVDRTKEMA